MFNFNISLLFALNLDLVISETGNTPSHIWVFGNNLLDDLLFFVVVVLASLHNVISNSVVGEWREIWMVQEVLKIAVFMLELLLSVGLTLSQKFFNFNKFFVVSFEEIVEPLDSWQLEESG